MTVQDIIKLDADIIALTAQLRSAIDTLKYVIYCQDMYPRFNTEVWIGEFDSTDTVYADNTIGEYKYTHLHSDSLIDAVVYAGQCKAIIYTINNNHNVTRITSFIRKNAETLRNHPDTIILQDLLYTCNESNLQLVKQLLIATKGDIIL